MRYRDLMPNGWQLNDMGLFKYVLITVILLLLFTLLATDLSADKYAGEIFRIGGGVRNFALGNTGVSDYGSTALAYWNPSLLAKDNRDYNHFELMHSEEFMGEVTYDIFSAVWGSETRYSFVLSRIGINNIPITKLPNPEDSLSVDNQPYVYKTVNNADYIAYFGFYREIGKYVIGFTPKFAYRYLAETSGYGFGADISTYFDINDDLLIGLTLRDFFTTRIFWDNGTHEMVRPGLDAELNYDFTIPFANSRARVFAGTEIMAEGRKEAATHSVGSFSFDYHLGLEIPVPEYLSFYAGYDVDNLTTGLTVNIKQYQINYAFKYNTELDNSHRVSLGLKLY
jgi:hypothetical protein